MVTGTIDYRDDGLNLFEVTLKEVHGEPKYRTRIGHGMLCAMLSMDIDTDPADLVGATVSFSAGVMSITHRLLP